MPLYEYRCTSCGYSFEKIQSFKAEPETVCPKCQGALIRPVTAPALRFEGAGWYVNDYAGKGAAKPPAAGDAKPDSGSGSGSDSGSTEAKPAAAAPATAAPASSSTSAPAAAGTSSTPSA